MLTPSGQKVQELTEIYTELYADEPKADVADAAMYWRHLSPDDLDWELERARERLAKLRAARSVTL